MGSRSRLAASQTPSALVQPATYHLPSATRHLPPTICHPPPATRHPPPATFPAPNQASWGDKDFVGYRVSDDIQTHNAYGVGVYTYVGPPLNQAQVPAAQRAPEEHQQQPAIASSQQPTASGQQQQSATATHHRPPSPMAPQIFPRLQRELDQWHRRPRRPRVVVRQPARRAPQRLWLANSRDQ